MAWHNECSAHKGNGVDRADFPEFYAKNVGLIRKAARRVLARAYALGGGAMDYDDLEQELTEVFIRAYDNYDPEKFRFSTYFMRAAFNRANFLMAKVEEERVSNGTRSVEEMGDWMDDNDEGLSVTVEDVTSLRPEECAQLQSLFRHWQDQLSPAAQLVLNWTLTPPDWLEHEFEAQIEHAEISRKLGVVRRSRAELNARYVVNTLKQITGRGAMFDQALEEVRAIARNTL